MGFADYSGEQVEHCSNFTIHPNPVYHSPEMKKRQTYNAYKADMWALGICFLQISISQSVITGQETLEDIVSLAEGLSNERLQRIVKMMLTPEAQRPDSVQFRDVSGYCQICWEHLDEGLTLCGECPKDQAKDSNPLKARPVNAQPGPAKLALSTPVIGKPPAVSSPTMAKSLQDMPKPDSAMAKPAPLIAKPPQVVAQPVPIMSKMPPVIPQPAPIAQSAPVLPQSFPKISQSFPEIPKSAPLVAQPVLPQEQPRKKKMVKVVDNPEPVKCRVCQRVLTKFNEVDICKLCENEEKFPYPAPAAERIQPPKSALRGASNPPIQEAKSAEDKSDVAVRRPFPSLGKPGIPYPVPAAEQIQPPKPILKGASNPPIQEAKSAEDKPNGAVRRPLPVPGKPGNAMPVAKDPIQVAGPPPVVKAAPKPFPNQPGAIPRPPPKGVSFSPETVDNSRGALSSERCIVCLRPILKRNRYSEKHAEGYDEICSEECAIKYLAFSDGMEAVEEIRCMECTGTNSREWVILTCGDSHRFCSLECAWSCAKRTMGPRLDETLMLCPKCKRQVPRDIVQQWKQASS